MLKNGLLFLFMTFLVSACSKKVNNLLISDYNTVEGISIGMPLSDAQQILEKKFYVEKNKVKIAEGEVENTEYNVYNNKSKKDLFLNFNGGYEKKNKDLVFRIVLLNPKYITDEGVRVGINVKELRLKAKLKSADFNFHDGLFIYSGKFKGGYHISLDPKKDYKTINYDSPPIKKIPGELLIKSIILF